jgi:hypothetical protein
LSLNIIVAARPRDDRAYLTLRSPVGLFELSMLPAEPVETRRSGLRIQRPLGFVVSRKIKDSGQVTGKPAVNFVDRLQELLFSLQEAQFPNCHNLASSIVLSM